MKKIRISTLSRGIQTKEYLSHHKNDATLAVQPARLFSLQIDEITQNLLYALVHREESGENLIEGVRQLDTLERVIQEEAESLGISYEERWQQVFSQVRAAYQQRE